jgi:hypothetical protein
VVFCVDHFYGGAAAGILACLASVVVIQSICKAFGDAGIEGFVAAF